MKIIFLFVIILSSISCLYAQKNGKITSRYGFEINRRPNIYYDAYISYVPEGWKPYLVLKLNIQNDVLQFTKKDDQFFAGFDVSFSLINDSTQRTVFTELWHKKINESDFNKTNSPQIYQTFIKFIPLGSPPGQYNIYIQITDTETGKVYYSKRDFLIPQNTNDQINNSIIKIINKNDSLSSEIIVGDNEVLVEYNIEITALLEIETVTGDSLTVFSELLFLNNNTKEPVSKNQYQFHTENNFFYFHEKFNPNILNEGDYQLNYQITHNSNSKLVKKKFNITWFDKPLYLYKTDLAIRPMKYIISREEFKKVEDLSDSRQDTWFQQYWEQKDPNPETPLNEIQLEFYERVGLANRKFSLRFKEGWETDRGKTLILYGEPDNIESFPYVISTAPYEIWFYNNLKQKITFIDSNKDGNYKIEGVEDIGELSNE